MKILNSYAMRSIACISFLFAGNAFAQTLTIDEVSVGAGSTVVVNISFTPGANGVRSITALARFNNAILSAPITVESNDLPHSGGANNHQCVLDGADGVFLSQSLGGANTFNAEGVACAVTFQIAAGTAPGVHPIEFDLASTLFEDADGEVAGTFDNGEIEVLDVAPLTVDIDETPIAFPAGSTGSPVSGTFIGDVIPAIPTGGSETASLTCASDTAGLTVSPTSVPNITNATPDITFTVSWTYSAVALAGNINCTVTDSDGGAHPFTVPVTAPVGTDGPPALTPNPANGGTVTVPGGQPDSNQCANIAISALGGAGAGQSATVTCQSDAADVTVNNGGPLNFAPGAAAQNVQVCVTLTDAAQSFADGVSCTGTDSAGPIAWSFNVAAPAGVATPTFVPASSLWSKLALFGIFAALGLLVLGLRRNH